MKILKKLRRKRQENRRYTAVTINGSDRVHISYRTGKRYSLKRDPLFFGELDRLMFQMGIAYFWNKRGGDPDAETSVWRTSSAQNFN